MSGSRPALTRRHLLQAAAAGGLLAAAACTADESGRRVLRTARPANTLATMVGVRIQLADGDDSLYGNVGLVAAALNGIGVRFVRERIYLPRYDAPAARAQQHGWEELARRVDRLRVTSPLGVVDDSAGTVAEFGEHIVANLGGAGGLVGTVENGNEPNSLDRSWNVDDPNAWVPLTRRRQQQMADVFRSWSGLQGIRLLGPSIGGKPGLKKFRRLGDLSRWLDIGNFHVYPGNSDSGIPGSDLDGMLDGVRVTAGDKPVWCTETGLHQAAASGVPMSYFPEDVSAEYVLRLLLEQAARGVQRVYLFELLDDLANAARTDSEAHFGLLRHNDRFDPKPAYHALQRFLGLMHDPGPTPGTQRLPRPVTIDGLAEDGRALAARKSDGRVCLCLWRAQQLWEPAQRRRIAPDPSEVRVTLDRRRDVQLHRPGRDDSVLRWHGVSHVDIPVSGSVGVLVIS